MLMGAKPTHKIQEHKVHRMNLAVPVASLPHMYRDMTVGESGARNQTRILYRCNVYHRHPGCPIIYLEAGSTVDSALVIP